MENENRKAPEGWRSPRRWRVCNGSFEFRMTVDSPVYFTWIKFVFKRGAGQVMARVP
jgi:hypothetical protein